jgi:hypothetical protein
MVNQLASDDFLRAISLQVMIVWSISLRVMIVSRGLKKYSHIDMVSCLDDTIDAMLHIEA